MDDQQTLLFAETWKILLQLDFITGSFLFHNSKQKNFKEKFIKLYIIGICVLTIVLLYGILYCEKFKKSLAYIIFGAMLQLFLTILLSMWLLTSNKKEIRSLFTWCEKIYEKSSFHQKLRKIVTEKVTWIHEWSIKILKYLRVITYVEFLGILTVIPVIGYFLPDQIYGKYQLPVPLFLPVKSQDNWIVFLSTSALQIVLLTETVTMGQLIWGVVLVILFHIYGFLEILEASVDQMKEDLLFLHDFRRKKDDLSPKMWISMLVDMICDVKTTISRVGLIFSKFFLLFEFTAYASFFIGSFLIVVIREQQLFGLAIMSNIFTFFVLCFITVTIEDKMSAVFDKFYDLPWYNLPVKEQKLVLQAMTCGENHTKFSSGGLHVIDLELFTAVMNAGYGNFLVLKDIVGK
ncbi:uncharacterized protein LOC134837202 [Culicoides brevitarsis]|uniref:uncharacterized protein LOC134837202 n=1 Tax=Culicoides brevitarsis TaxID=469753 RepID=UPI00307B93F6